MSGGGSRRRRPKEPRSQQVSLDQLLGDVGEWVPEEPKRPIGLKCFFECIHAGPNGKGSSLKLPISSLVTVLVFVA